MRNGYGKVSVRKHLSYTTNRVALALTVGTLTQGVVACHRCDNPPCCNPSHLFPGSQRENGLDMSAKGRGTRVRGEAKLNRVLTEDDIRAIRSEEIVRGSNTQLSQRFGVSTTTIRRILRREKWSHVQ
jgi:hypothetical protein